jgi:hypothetical protein
MSIKNYMATLTETGHPAALTLGMVGEPAQPPHIIQRWRKNITCMLVRINDSQLEALQKVAKYLRSDEETYFEEGGRIWEPARELAEWLNEVDGSLKALDNQCQRTAEQMQREGVPFEEWPKHHTVEDREGKVSLIWDEDELPYKN